MWVTILVVVGSVLLVVSGFAWAARRATVEQARAVGALRVVELGGLRLDRLAAVRGRVRPVQAFDDPVLERPVAFFEARLFRTDGSGETLRQLREGERVRLDDGTGVAEIELEGADVAIPMEELEHADGALSERMKALIPEEDQPEPSRRARYALAHRALSPGDEITVVGVPREGAGGPVFSAAHGPLFVTAEGVEALQRRELADVRAMNRMLAVAAVLGATFIAVGAALMIQHG